MENPIKVIAQMDGNGTRVCVWEYQALEGSRDIQNAQALYYAARVGMKLRQVSIQINQSEVILESGLLQYMSGNITIDASTGGLAGLAKKMATSALTNETTFRPHYRGTGEIVLEPSFGHFIIMKLDNEEMITDKGMFYASEHTVNVGVATQKNISAALFGGEGFFQTKLVGSGWVVLESPVPMQEIRCITLNNQKLQVDGNFAILRKGKIDFHVERSTKSFMGSARSGEGFLQTFVGTGEVWLAPTQSVYQNLNSSTLADLSQTRGSFGQNVKS